MENTRIEDLLFRSFSDNLSEAEEKELLHWLEADESHTTILSEMADWWAIAHVPRFASERKAAFERRFGCLRAQATPKKLRTGINRWSRVAAAILWLLSVGLTAYLVGRQGTEADDTTAYFETVTPMGTSSKVILPDRTVVWINAGSSLKYATDFNRKRREVLLTGEAYFDVSPDSTKPFVVKSEQLDIQVLGTRFNVKAYTDEEVTDVALVSGSVKIHLARDSSRLDTVTLTPDHRLRFNKQTASVEVQAYKSVDACAWTGGVLKFSEQPFLQIVKDIERKFNVHIHVASSRLKKEVFSGSFSSDYGLDEILREVDVDRKYTWSRNGTEIIISDK